jgi:sulfite exporter TauE/SafE
MMNRFVYNFGRIFTYGVLGAIVGAFGALAGLTSYQSLLSAAMGIVLVLLGVSGVSVVRIPLMTPLLHQLTSRLKSFFGKLLASKRGGTLFLMGGINGLLPCGLTYFALTYCITLPNAWQGFVYMMLFGLGTVPVMVGIPALAAVFSVRLHRNFRHTTALVMIVLGALLVFRSVWVHPAELTPMAGQASEVVCP